MVVRGGLAVPRSVELADLADLANGLDELAEREAACCDTRGSPPPHSACHEDGIPGCQHEEEEEGGRAAGKRGVAKMVKDLLLERSDGIGQAALVWSSVHDGSF